jgi:hypothetical protein
MRFYIHLQLMESCKKDPVPINDLLTYVTVSQSFLRDLRPS